MTNNYIPFDYDIVRDVFERFTVEEIKEFTENGEPGDKLGELALIEPGEYNPVIQVRNMVTIFVYGDYDLADPKAMSWIVSPAESEEETDGTLLWYSSYEWPAANQDLVELEANETTSQQMVLGGVTDFYERRGWWPHANMAVEIQHPEWPKVINYGNNIEHYKKVFPMTYLGELVLEGRKADIFCESDTLLPHNHFPQPYVEEEEKAILIIFQDSDVTPEWVIRSALEYPMAQVTANSRRFVASTRWPYAPVWLQDAEVFDAPFNHFVTQIPLVDYSDLPKINTDGYWYVFWDNQDNFKIVYQNS